LCSIGDSTIAQGKEIDAGVVYNRLVKRALMTSTIQSNQGVTVRNATEHGVLNVS
jgi:hypothetical protein